MTTCAARQAGFTLVEFLIGIGLIGILGAGSIGLVDHFIRMSFYYPNQTRVSEAASEILEAAAEGSLTTIASPPTPRFLGLRFAERMPGLTAIQLASATQVQFFTDGPCEPTPVPARCLVRLSLDGTTNHLLRSVRPFTQEETIPYYADATLRVYGDGTGGAVFTYLDSTGAATTNLAAIRRIEIAIRVDTGTGDVSQSEGRIRAKSSVAIRFP